MNADFRTELKAMVDAAQRERLLEAGEGIVYPLEQDLLRENRKLYNKVKYLQTTVRNLENDLAAAQKRYHHEAIRSSNYKQKYEALKRPSTPQGEVLE